MEAPDFWNDMANATKTNQRAAAIKKDLAFSDSLDTLLDDAYTANELSDEESEYMDECREIIGKIEKAYEELEIQTLFSDRYDFASAILTIHPGAGGTESQDWAEMLFRMYTRWGEREGFKPETLDYQEGDEAGIKSVTVSFTGEKAYGLLKAEKGIHRLVRISPFDASGRRHTSFTSVEVMPVLENTDDDIVLNPDELRYDIFRSSGAGGQKVNKTSSAVRITHLPTGIVVTCQNERSQLQNKAFAEMILKAKLADIRREEQEKEMEKIRGVQREIAWGSQIRSYVFCPYTMVKDHRTNYETGNIAAVMDGDITPFMYEYLKMRGAVNDEQ